MGDYVMIFQVDTGAAREAGWGQILAHLKGYLEGGRPQPFFKNR